MRVPLMSPCTEVEVELVLCRSVYVGCVPNDRDPDFLDATWQVRDTIEQVDVSKNLIEKYPDVSVSQKLNLPSLFLADMMGQTFQLAVSTNDIYSAITSGKIASLLGIEGCVHSRPILDSC